jgi:hypothetical protein
MPKTALERLEDAAAALMGKEVEPKPLEKPRGYSREEIRIMESPAATLGREEHRTRRWLRDAEGVAPYSDDPKIDAAISDEAGEAFSDGDLALATLISLAKPLIQDELTLRVQGVLQELLRHAVQGPGDPDPDVYLAAVETASPADIEAAVKAAKIKIKVSK